MPIATLLAERPIHHVGLRVVDAFKTKIWYQEFFGFDVDREFSIGNLEFIWLRAPRQQPMIIEIIGGGDLPRSVPPAEGINQLGFAHICLSVEDVEKAVADLNARGVAITMGVIAGVQSSGVEKLAFVADLWGNSIELAQYYKRE